MNATIASIPAKPTDHPARRLMARMNMTLFYCLGAAVLVETAAERRCASGAPSSDRARWLREYVSCLWPEFSWDAACDAFFRRAQTDARQGCGDAAAESVLSCHRAAFYAALSHIADDAVLRSALAAFRAEEDCCADAATSARRGLFARVRRARAARTHLGHMRGVVLRRAFELLQQHWLDVPPFPAMPYEDFLERAWTLLRPHAGLHRLDRLVYAGCGDGRVVRSFDASAARQASGGATRVLPRPAMLR